MGLRSGILAGFFNNPPKSLPEGTTQTYDDLNVDCTQWQESNLPMTCKREKDCPSYCSVLDEVAVLSLRF